MRVNRLSGVVVAASLVTSVLAFTASPAVAEESTAQQLFATLPLTAEAGAGYDRELFDHWVDEDADGCDTRQEVLIAESLVTPDVAADCAVVSGEWFSYFDGETWADPSDVDIDHMVALAEAWRSGANTWTAPQRRAFANDLVLEQSLEAVTDNVNASKGDRDPSEWLPPLVEVHCQYAISWVLVKYRWNLSVDSSEEGSLDDLLAQDGCGDTAVTVPTKANTASPEPDPEPEPGPAPGPRPDEPGTKRLAGTDRYSTAAAIVQDSFPAGPVPVVFIATGEAYADALAGGPAADALGGPVLPVARAGIPAPILSELDRLDPARIIILGGSGAVSDAIAGQLQTYTDGSVSRIAGSNRYATAALVAQQTFTGPVPEAIIATGAAFADALAGGAVGALTDSPVLLVEPSCMPAETKQQMDRLQPSTIVVLGGTTTVSDAAASGATCAAPAPPPAPEPAPQPPPSQTYYANCSEARAAGAAPLYRGQPGYRAGLDRDNDGVACE